MKKILCFLIMLTLLLTIVPIGTLAAEEVTVDSISTKNRGDSITISGNTTFSEVDIKVLYPNGGIYNIETVQSNDGRYSYRFTLYSALPYGKYTVVAGKGDKVANTTFLLKQKTSGPGGSPSTPGETPNTPENPKQEEKEQPKVTTEDNGSVKVEMAAPTVGEDGVASVSFDNDLLTNALENAVANAQGKKKIQIVIPETEGVTSYNMDIPANFISELEALYEFEVNTSIAKAVIPSNMLKASEIAGAEGVAFKIAAVDKSTLSPKNKAAIGNRPVVDLNLSVNGENISWENKNAPVTVSIPYAAAEDELKECEKITAWYLDESDNAIPVYSARYNTEVQELTFTTTHFSKFAVVFVNKTFVDIAKYGWAKNSIEVLASKGIIKGISDTHYNPAGNIKRADYVTLLVRALDLTATVDSNFDDVKEDAYYYETVGIARKLGIINGVGGNKFIPESDITRQEMMTVTARVLKVLNKIEAQGDAADLKKFTDASQVAPYAVESIASLVKNDLVEGDGSRISPMGKTTRAEASVLMYRIYNK